MDTKLRSFQVENMAKYEKFREIQQGRNKKIGQRLNELIEKEVKEAFKFAETQPWPEPEDSLNDVYVNYPKNLILKV